MNTTRGVDACYMKHYDGRLYFYGGSQKDRLYIGGNPGNELSVSTGLGGAFVDIEPGSGQEIRSVLKFKTYNGATIITLLTYHPNTSKGARYNLLENTITLTNEYSTSGYTAEMVDSVVGCSSYYGADTFLDGLYSVNRFGLAYTTKVMENQNNVKTEYASDAIEPIFYSLEGEDYTNARLLCIHKTIYIMFYDSIVEGLDPVIFCYDTALKA